MNLRDAVIDETRWPKIFRTLQSAGLFSSCGCSGCGDCQAAARRFVRGVTRYAHYTGPHQRFRFGDRYPVLTRSLGDQRIQLLVDSARAPSIVDLRIEREEQETEFDATKAECCGGPRSWAEIWGGWRAATTPCIHGDIREHKDLSKAPGVPVLASSGWCGPLRLDLFSRIPVEARGLYVIRWTEEGSSSA